MYVLTVLQRTGDVEPITLNVLSTVWNRLKGSGGTAFERLAAKLWKEAPTIVEYGETTKKKAKAYCAKLKGMMHNGRANLAKILSCRIDFPTSLVYGGWHGKGRK